MPIYTLLKTLADVTRKWRDNIVECLKDASCRDLGYRPSTFMSSFGWIIGHQATAYDFTLNVLILGTKPRDPELFEKYRPGTSGDWDGTPMEILRNYYDQGERRFLEWAMSSTNADLDKIIKRKGIPAFFNGMTVREIIVNLFCHLNHHNGHLEVIRQDWEKHHQIQ